MNAAARYHNGSLGTVISLTQDTYSMHGTVTVQIDKGGYNMITKKRVSFVVMMFMMICFVLPLNMEKAYAEEGENPSISVGTGNIEKGNKVYMGVRYVEEKPVPISWLVLGASNSSDLKNMMDQKVNPENARLLITEKAQEMIQYVWNDFVGWQGSWAQRWCKSNFMDGSVWNESQERFERYFDFIETDVMLTTSKKDAEYGDYTESALDNERIFLLSAEEASDKYCYFNSGEDRVAYQWDKDEKCSWWLRSVRTDPQIAGCVLENGGVKFNSCVRELGARPAFNIDLDNVIYTSAAEGGKTSGTTGADALTAVPDNTTKEWKLTLRDYNRTKFEANATADAILEADEGYSDWTVPVIYSEAKTGENEYVSVILADSKDKALYYGNIAKNSASSPKSGQNVTIPPGLAAGNYTMYVFSEQINEDKRTDYSSKFRAINLKVNSYPPGSIPMQSIQDAKVVLSKNTFTYNSKTQKPAIKTIDGKTLTEDKDFTIQWLNSSSKNVGSYSMTVIGKGDYTGTTKASYKIVKAPNPLSVKPQKATIKYKKLKKKAQKLPANKLIKFTKKINDSKKYKISSVKKEKKNFKKYFKINAKTGKLTVKKGLQTGTYKVRVKIKAFGNGNYKASKTKTIVSKIIIR